MSGNPVLFVFEKDVFYCGYDLADFFEREVFIPLRSSSKSLKRQEWDATVLGACRLKHQEKQQIMSSIHEELAMESKLKSCYDKEDGLLFHGHTHSQNQTPHNFNVSDNAQDHRVHQNHLHHRSVRQVNWEMLNQRLLAELQNADANDQWTHSREGIRARHNEVLSRKSLSEEPLRPFEGPTKSLSRSAGNSPRMGQHIMSRYAYFHEKPLPAKVLAQFTIAAPPWAAKMARHIPMWSELVENKENIIHDSNVTQSDIIESKACPPDSSASQSKDSLCDVQVVHSKESSLGLNMVHSKVSPQDLNVVEGKDSLHEVNNAPTQKNIKRQEEQGARIVSGNPSKRWLVLYFEDMEKRLRRGGWKEDEIEEMMVAALPPNAEFLLHKETRGEIQDILDSSAHAMSLSLQKAGWSVLDVLEILSLDLKHPKRLHIGNIEKNAK